MMPAYLSDHPIQGASLTDGGAEVSATRNSATSTKCPRGRLRRPPERTRRSRGAMSNSSRRTIAIAALLTWCAFAQAPPVLHGTWTATAGPTQVYRGSWSAQPLPDNPNAVRGSWTLVNGVNQVVLEGTWSAEKSVGGWQGTWSARILTRPSSPGRLVSGTWQATTGDSSGKTLAEMLQHTMQRQVTGSWRSGRLAGNWSLRGSR
jgi:hypothetical protein